MKATREQIDELIAAAVEVRENAYAPYSKFHVGAAILSNDGRVFRGVNVENSSYGLTICAERTAASSAVASGSKSFVAIAIATQGGHSPCGACRQFLIEFGDDLEIVLVDTEEQRPPRRTSITTLQPDAFRFPSGG